MYVISYFYYDTIQNILLILYMSYNINIYLSHLYDYLGYNDCFLSGAFVIDDKDNNLFNLLYSEKKNDLSWFPSHTTFLNKENSDPEFKLYETVLDTNHQLECNCPDGIDRDKRIIESIKWYKFVQRGKSFIYLKPETHQTKSVSHAVDAWKRYIQGKSNESCRISRREDCHKEGCKMDNNSNKTFTYTDKNKNKTETIKVVETYDRKGDEVFIPLIINNYILSKKNDQTSNIDNKILITDDQKNNTTLTIPYNTNGGKKRMYKRRRTYKNTKSKNLKKSLRNKSIKKKRK